LLRESKRQHVPAVSRAGIGCQDLTIDALGLRQLAGSVAPHPFLQQGGEIGARYHPPMLRNIRLPEIKSPPIFGGLPSLRLAP